MKKLLTLLIVLFLLVGCSTSKKEREVSTSSYEEIGSKYLDKLTEFVAREKNYSNNTENLEFKAFLDELFIYFIKDDYLTLKDVLKNYEALGIEKPEVTLGEINYGPDEESINQEIEYLNKLLSFEYNSLSFDQQITYECLEYSFYEDLCGVGYTKYAKFFNNNASLISNLITTFVEFKFNKKEDVEDYLCLVKDVKRYLNEALEYTNNQYRDGIYYSDYSINTTIDYINSITSRTKDNVLITTFNNSLDEMDFLSSKEKEQFKDLNTEIVLKEVIPAFNDLADKLNNYKGKLQSEDNSLFNISEEYAKILFLIKSSDNRDLDLIFDDLIKYYNDMVEIIISYGGDEEFMKKYHEIYENDFFSSGYKNIIDYLIENSTNEMIKDIVYKVDEIDPSADDGYVLAYYVSPPIDDPLNNVIKVSTQTTTNDLGLYETLAHEAVPGHMYQHSCFANKVHDKIRDIIYFIGYSEGWAMYSQIIALNYLELEPEMVDYILAIEVSGYLRNCILDLAINYYDMNKKQVKNLINLDDSVIDYFFDILTDMPCTYAPYGIGYLNMAKIYDAYKDKADFDYDSFNNLLVENGDMPFPILNKYVSSYMLKNK